MKILTIVGARPQFIKAAMVSRAIAAHNQSDTHPRIIEEIIHTGQHYDANMSQIFFEQMGIPKPVANLEAGNGTHGQMTGKMLTGIEQVIMERQPDWVLVYGDTNSTLAGSLAAAKLHVPVAHVEAGLRSFNPSMPEEINRVLTDHVSTLLFCPTKSSVANLAKEGITKGVHHVGDVMYDAALVFGDIAAKKSQILTDLDIQPQKYLLATVHRAENTDVPDRLRQILSAFEQLDKPVIFPVHPRTRKKIADLSGWQDPCFKNIRCIDPVSFLDMVQLEKHAACILTDSGGVQKEAYFYGVPCITLRDETEWVETVAAGWNQVVGADKDKIISSVKIAKKVESISEYGDGHTADRIVTDLFHYRPNITPQV
jgi:UDP-GlcNAc3NAcA epimerase